MLGGQSQRGGALLRVDGGGAKEADAVVHCAPPAASRADGALTNADESNARAVSSQRTHAHAAAADAQALAAAAHPGAPQTASASAHSPQHRSLAPYLRPDDHPAARGRRDGAPGCISTAPHAFTSPQMSRYSGVTSIPSRCARPYETSLSARSSWA